MRAHFHYQSVGPQCRSLVHRLVFALPRECQQSERTLRLPCREFEDGASLDGSVENMERGSLASFGSGTTSASDSDTLKVSGSFVGCG